MKNFWIRMNIRWSREELLKWSSLQRAAYLLWPLLIYFVVHDVVEVLLWIAVNVVFMGKESFAVFFQAHAATFQGVINGLAILAGVAAVSQAVRGELAGAEKESGKKAERAPFGMPGRRAADISLLFTRYFVLAAIAFLASLGLNLLMNLLGLTSVSAAYEETAQAQYEVNFVIGLFLYGVVSPLGEEAVFRGMIYNRMKRCFTYPVALCVSSLIFGCYHGNLVQALYGTILGILIAWCYEKCESFAAPMLVHGVANVSMYAMTYHGGPGGMSRAVSVVVMVVSLLGAGGFLWYLQKKCLGNGAVRA